MAAWTSFLLLVASIIWIWATLTYLPIEDRRDRIDWLPLPGVLVIVLGFVYFGGRAILAAAIRRRVNRLSGLTDVACLAALQVVEARRVAAREHTPSRSSRDARRMGAAPSPQPYGVSATGAVELVVGWMRFLSAGDARVAESATGVDAESSAYVVRVSAGELPVGVEAMRELAGTVSVTGRRALYFSTAGYTDEANEFAGRAKIALFQFAPCEGTLSGADGDGEALLSTGH
ncbi:restriction endonuclease [Homoserinimonas sp. OAct 916]|uniref:restriction endonuclease n=1 Tax=Homoserinimonas sp. OAct 916 TaxID=2211450 RepID=UPI001300B472|nr:restriction endonuclease [Homoserinimonas sp. OAct 916]